jgi:hypothetical protein
MLVRAFVSNQLIYEEYLIAKHDPLYDTPHWLMYHVGNMWPRHHSVELSRNYTEDTCPCE